MGINSFACWVILHAFCCLPIFVKIIFFLIHSRITSELGGSLLSADIFQNYFFLNSFKNNIRAGGFFVVC